jgi:hypothetical protein
LAGSGGSRVSGERSKVRAALVVEAPGSTPCGVSEPTSYSGGGGAEGLSERVLGGFFRRTASVVRARYGGDAAPSTLRLSRPPFWGVDFEPGRKARGAPREVLAGLPRTERQTRLPSRTRWLGRGKAWPAASALARVRVVVPRRPCVASAGDGGGCGLIAFLAKSVMQLTSRGSAASWRAERRPFACSPHRRGRPQSCATGGKPLRRVRSGDEEL